MQADTPGSTQVHAQWLQRRRRLSCMGMESACEHHPDPILAGRPGLERQGHFGGEHFLHTMQVAGVVGGAV
eukprot:102039-Pelagomonas_calceolata.AAC.8